MIQIRGPHTMRGMCRRSRDELFTADGYYPTGDLGHLDDDGFMFYHGRSDDMFKVSGATVYPSEVEQALRAIDGVDNAFVTNVTGDDGDRVGAVVICDPATTTAEQLRDSARKLLSSFKVPTVWLLLDTDDAVPRGTTGKVDVRAAGPAAEPSRDRRLAKSSRTSPPKLRLGGLGDHAAVRQVLDQRCRALGEVLGHRCASDVFVACFQCGQQPAVVCCSIAPASPRWWETPTRVHTG